MLHQRIENMWWNTKRAPNILLHAASIVYALLSKFDQKQRLKHAVQPPIPMISVGNITSRGDGANNQTPHLISQYSKAHEVGDEAVLLFRMSDCPVIAGRDRIAGAQLAAEHGDILILDDGFQYRQLQRICDVVLVPAEGVGNGCLIPAGPLREPVTALDRADMIVRSGSCNVTPLTDQKEWLWSARAGLVRDWNSQDDILLEASKPVHLLTAIARPRRVLNDLMTLGYEIAQHSRFADHHGYTRQDVEEMLQSHRSIVTTAKDAVKLQPLWPCEKPLWVLEQQIEAEDGLARHIVNMIKARA